MEFKVSTKGDVLAIQLIGTFDFAGYHAFKEQFGTMITRDNIASIEMDMAGVDYIDSSALGILILMRERAQSAGKKIKLVRANASVREILDMANLGKLFTIA